MRRFIAIVLACLSLTGCGRAQPQVEDGSAKQKATVVSDGCVALKDVDPPVWDSVFASASISGQCFSIDWGTGKDWVMTGSSGYPGFNHPILVITDGECIGGSIELVTNYGKYTYECNDMEPISVVLSDDGKNLVKKGSGEMLINFSSSGECLWLYNPKKEEAVRAEFKHGTSVIVN